MLNEELRHELIEMREEDLSVREELLNSGQLGGAYVPRMEAIHVKNAARLRELSSDQLKPRERLREQMPLPAAR